MDAGSPERRRRPGGGLLLLTVLGLVVRIAFLLLEPQTHPVADERTWTNWAVEGLATPRVHFSPFRIHMIFYPPLYPYFIAVLFALSSSLAAVKLAQVLVSALLIPAVARLGEAVFSARAGVLAAGIVAFYPELVWFSAHFWSETLFITFLWWALDRLVAADGEGRVGSAFLSGLLWGLAILTRETALYFTPVAALFLAWGRGARGRARGAAFLVAAVLTVAPWTLRNYLVFHAFIPVSTAGGLNLWQGNARFSREEVYRRYEAVQGRVEQYRHAQREGIAAIWDRQPAWIFEKLRDEMPNFWEADSQALVHIKRGAYGPARPVMAWAAAAIVLLPYAVILGLFVVGLAVLPWERRSLFLLGFLAYYTLIHVVTHGYARYRLPALPVVMLVAAAAAEAIRSVPARAASRERKLLAAVVGLALLLSLIPSVRINLEDPAFGLGVRTGPAEEAPTP